MVDITAALANHRLALSRGDHQSALQWVLPLSLSENDQIASNALHLAGICALEMGQTEEAVGYFKRAIEKKNTSVKLYELCWKLLFQSEEYEEAKRILKHGLEVCDKSATLLAHMGSVETRLGNFAQAEILLEEAVEVDSESALAWINRGSFYEIVGRVKESISCFQRALSIEPENTIAISDLLLTLNYLPMGRKGLLQAHQLYTNPLRPFPVARSIKPAGDGKIRIAYISSDFRFHAVSFFFFPLLCCHDTSQFDIYCYADNASQDEVTQLLKDHATYWRDINALSDEKVADLMVEDGIQILVDLSGHSAGRRLKLLKSKPAPYQVSYLGYPNTLGLTEIDYRIVDSITDPMGEDDSFFYEKLHRMAPPFLCYCPLGRLPDITELPARTNGYVTFGSFNRLSKLSDDTVRLWCRVLKQVPDSKLLLKTRVLTEPGVARDIVARFLEEGVSGDRILCEGGTTSHVQYLEDLRRVDIALDTSPYNGTTTTCNNLVMGIPVLTLRGDRHASRVSASILEAVSLHDLIASNESDFIRIASLLSTDLDRLQGIRASLRETMLGSPLTDGRLLARKIESFYLSLVTI